MKKSLSKYCSRLQAERYLLNKMTPEEETGFQMHLETCESCRKYIDSIRKISCLIADEELAYIPLPVKKKIWEKKRLKARFYMPIVASILIVVGVLFSIFKYKDCEHGMILYETHIDYLSKADCKIMKTDMLFPEKESVAWLAEKPLMFRWNMEADYQLTVRQGNQTIVDVEGFGDNYSMPAVVKIEDFAVLDWNINIEDKEYKGKIYVKKIIYPLYEKEINFNATSFPADNNLPVDSGVQNAE